MHVKLSLTHSKCSIYVTYYISVNIGLTTETEPPPNQQNKIYSSLRQQCGLRVRYHDIRHPDPFVLMCFLL